MFSEEELIRSIGDDRERAVVEELRRRLIKRTPSIRLVRRTPRSNRSPLTWLAGAR